MQLKYDLEFDVIETMGFNPGILDSVVPSAVHVDRAAIAEAQVEQLLKSGKAFSASGIGTCAIPGLGMPELRSSRSKGSLP